MSVRARLLAVLLALLLPGVALLRWMASVGPSSTPLRPPELSATIGPWTLETETQLSVEHFAMLEPDAYLWRLYQAPGRSPIWVYVAVYGGRAGYEAGAHDPEVCYPAQGWEIVGAHDVDIPLAHAVGADGGTLRAKLLDAQQGNLGQAVVYWFQPAQRWPRSATTEQVARLFDAMAGRPQYAFVRLAAPVTPGLRAEADITEFAAQIAWPIRDALSAEAAASARSPL
jgi:EpsI family protein